MSVSPPTTSPPTPPIAFGSPDRWTGRAARQSLVREHNLSLVFTHILEPTVPVTRARIAADTGLTRATVSDLVECLIAGRLVKELAPRSADRAGRPGVPLAPAERTVVGIGLEIGVDHLGASVIDLTGIPVTQRVIAQDLRGSDPDAAMQRLGALLQSVLADIESGGMRPAGICVALPGIIEHATGLLRYAPNLGWRDVSVLAALRDLPGASGLAVTAGNDADLAARAEAKAWARAAGIALSSVNFLYISGLVGIGGAVVRSGELATGVHGWGGEIGHTLLDPHGPRCRCGATGCLEQYAGKDAMLARAGLPLTSPPEALLTAAESGGSPGRMARRALDEAASALGRAAANIVNVLDLDLVVLGGHYATLYDELAPGVQQELDERVLASRWAPVGLNRARLSELGALQGAALAVIDSVIAHPGAWAEA